MWPYATPGLAAAEWQLKWRLARKRKTRKASGSAGFSVLSGGDGVRLHLTLRPPASLPDTLNLPFSSATYKTP